MNKISLNSSNSLSWIKSAVIGGCLSIGILAASPASAAVITWQTVQNIVSDADVSTQGTLVSALNIGKNSSTQVNGVVFAAANPSGGSNITFGSGSGALNVQITSGSGSIVQTSFLNATGAFASLSSSYQNLLAEGFYQGGNLPLSYTIQGLTSGQTYLVQFWINDSRNSAVIWNRYGTFTAGNTSGNVDYNAADVSGGLGQYVIGTFTANAATQVITVYAGSTAEGGGSPSPQLSAFQLRAIPEPSTYAVLVIGALALFAPKAARRLKKVS